MWENTNERDVFGILGASESQREKERGTESEGK